jgi:hypothetical protein
VSRAASNLSHAKIRYNDLKTSFPPMKFKIEPTGPNSAVVKVEGYERWGVVVRWNEAGWRDVLIEQAKWALREKITARTRDKALPG